MNSISREQKVHSVAHKAGGKSSGLFFLKDHGFTVPFFSVISHDTLNQIIEGAEQVDSLVTQLVSNKNIPLWAVRSSAHIEDGNEQSYAGFFKTELNVKIEDLESAVNSVLNSYKRNKGEFPADAGFDIIIQQMIDAEYSGVIFSHNPENLEDETIQISLIPGLGETLVSGKTDAFFINYLDGKFSYGNLKDQYRGEFFDEGLKKIEKTGEEILHDIKGFLPQLVKGVRKLARLKRFPVDVEFTISGGKLFWLQVRPITTGKEKITIWDKTAAEANFPGLTLPLSISLATKSFYRAYTNMAGFLGMPEKYILEYEPLLKSMTGSINGAMYYNVTAWQKLIYLLPFGKNTSDNITSIWGMKSAFFSKKGLSISPRVKLKMLFRLLISLSRFKALKRKYYKFYDTVHLQYPAVSIENKTIGQLIDDYKQIELKLAGNWEVPMLNNVYSVMFSPVLKFLLRGSRLTSLYPNFVNDILFSQGDVISVTILQSFQNLVHEIKSNLTLRNAFEQKAPAEIVEYLKEKSPAFYQKIVSYISMYGARSEGGELKMETINYREDPMMFVSLLKSMTGVEGFSERKRTDFDFRQIIKQHYRFNLFKRYLLLFFIHQAINRFRDRENFKFMRTRTFDLLRQIFRAIDEKLLAENLIEEKGDSLYLELPEILDLKKAPLYSGIISRRKQLYADYSKSDPAVRYIQKGDKFIPDHNMSEDLSSDVIYGTGCSSGEVKGEVLLIDENASQGEYLNKILVSTYFEPGKLAYFSHALGLISVRGNLLSHTAIVCREMGIPAIVGAKGLMSMVKSGDTIVMNGGTGQIKIFSKSE